MKCLSIVTVLVLVGCTVKQASAPTACIPATASTAPVSDPPVDTTPVSEPPTPCKRKTTRLSGPYGKAVENCKEMGGRILDWRDFWYYGRDDQLKQQAAEGKLEGRSPVAFYDTSDQIGDVLFSDGTVKRFDLAEFQHFNQWRSKDSPEWECRVTCP